ncbi:MAG TPA: hypothetical protein VHB25_05805 [Gemmatimonadaceae bacterium]|nr:hypothetical protein [Gemmatimonadaceae bacterium]
MTSVCASVGALLVQAAIRDTVIMIPASRGVIGQVADVIHVLILLVVLALLVAGAIVVWKLRRTQAHLEKLIDRVSTEVGPVLKAAGTIGEDLSHITSSIRDHVDEVNTTIAAANDRVRQAVAITEDRLDAFNALLEVVQQEAEGLFVSTASAVRGVRRGARSFGRRGGMEFASDELDAADAAEESELLEEDDGDDGDAGPDTDAGTGALAAAPRLRPRPRSRRGL